MESAKDIQVSDDYLTLSAILDEYDLTVKWLSRAVGLSESQVYRYRSGDATIPSVVWRVLYKKTRDLRIVQLVTGDVPVTVVDLVKNQTVFDRIDAPSLKQLVRARREQIAVEENLLEILADGAVDRRDAKAVAAYKRNHPKMIATATKIYMAVMDEFERSRK